MLATVRRMALAMPPRARFVAYAATKPARGLKKDQEQYLISPQGTRYPGTAATLEPVRLFMGEFSLPENLLLQCLVHKSFAHGSVPYNEKLAILGQQLFRFEASRSAVSAPDTAPKKAAVNNLNFDISHNAIEILSSTPVVSAVCDKAGLAEAMFYKPANDKVSPTIKAKVIHALVGAVLLEKGALEAARFMSTRLLQGEYNVFSIASALFVHN